MSSNLNIIDIYNLDNFQCDRKIYKIRFKFCKIDKLDKLNKIFINDIVFNDVSTIDKHRINILDIFKKLNILLNYDKYNYNIVYKKKNYTGNINIITNTTIIRNLYDGQNFIGNIKRFQIDTYMSDLELESESEFELLICEIKEPILENLYYNQIYNSLYNFGKLCNSHYDFYNDTNYNIYFRFHGTYNLNTKMSNKKIKSFMIPIHFQKSYKNKNSDTGFLVVNYYKPRDNIAVFVLKKIIDKYDTISLSQTINCHCKNFIR